MATNPGRIRPWRYLSAFTAIVAALYALVLFTGGGGLTPKLGIDLQGGTRVNLQARTENGQPRWNASFTNSDRTSMCQNRSGRFKSMIKNRPHRHTNGNAIV